MRLMKEKFLLMVIPKVYFFLAVCGILSSRRMMLEKKMGYPFPQRRNCRKPLQSLTPDQNIFFSRQILFSVFRFHAFLIFFNIINYFNMKRNVSYKMHKFQCRFIKTHKNAQQYLIFLY